MDKEQLVQQIYDHLDADHVESALMGCLRLSRSIKDHLNTATFLWELLYKRQDVVRGPFRGNDFSTCKNLLDSVKLSISDRMFIEHHVRQGLALVSGHGGNTESRMSPRE